MSLQLVPLSCICADVGVLRSRPHRRCPGSQQKPAFAFLAFQFVDRYQERFLKALRENALSSRRCAPDPTGVKNIGRWHTPGSLYGWHVVEGDAAGVAELEAMWVICWNYK